MSVETRTARKWKIIYERFLCNIMPELEKSRQMLPFIHLSNLSVAEEAISNSFPQNFQHPKSSAGPKSPTPVLHPIKNPTAFLFLPPRELPTLTAAAARPSELPPCIPALPRPLTTSRPVESLLAAVRKREKKGPAEPPTCNYSHPHPRRQNTSIDSAPGELSLPDLPDHHVPLQKQPARTKANPNPRCASDHATHTHTHNTPSQCPTRRRRPFPRRRRRRARSPGPSAKRFSTRRSVLRPRADPAKPLSGDDRSIWTAADKRNSGTFACPTPSSSPLSASASASSSRCSCSSGGRGRHLWAPGSARGGRTRSATRA